MMTSSSMRLIEDRSAATSEYCRRSFGRASSPLAPCSLCSVAAVFTKAAALLPAWSISIPESLSIAQHSIGIYHHYLAVIKLWHVYVCVSRAAIGEAADSPLSLSSFSAQGLHAIDSRQQPLGRALLFSLDKQALSRSRAQKEEQ